MVFSETNRGKIFQRLLWSNMADILTPSVTMTRKWPRLANAERDFDQICADFQQLGRYLTALRTLS